MVLSRKEHGDLFPVPNIQPYNIHASNIIQTQKVRCMNIYIYKNKKYYMHACNKISEKEAMS